MSKTPSGPARSARPARRNAKNTSVKNPNNNRSAPAPSGRGFTRFRRSHPVLGALIPVGLVLLVLVTLVVVKTTGGPATKMAEVSLTISE